MTLSGYSWVLTWQPLLSFSREALLQFGKSSSKRHVLKPSSQCAGIKKWVLARSFGYEVASFGVKAFNPVLLLLFTIWDKDPTFLPEAGKVTSHCRENVDSDGPLTRGKTQRKASSPWSCRLPESWEQNPVLWKEVLLWYLFVYSSTNRLRQMCSGKRLSNFGMNKGSRTLTHYQYFNLRPRFLRT